MEISVMKTLRKQFALSYKITHGFPGGASGKDPACQCRRHIRDVGLISGLGGSPGEGHGNLLQ